MVELSKLREDNNQNKSLNVCLNERTELNRNNEEFIDLNTDYDELLNL